MTDPFLLECSGLPAGARVVAFEGFEEISTTYRYEVDVLVDPEGDLGDAVGASATLTIVPEAERPTRVHGVVAAAKVIDHLDDHDLYRVTLVPRVKDILGLDRHSRVFVGETVPSILQTLLREAGLGHEDCDFRLTREYEPVEFVCQYRESTLDFLTRWMERDGIYFYFSHEGPRERLVVVDDLGKHDAPRASVPFTRTGGAMELSGLRRFRAERSSVPGRVHVDDYDYLHPGLPVRGEAVVEGGGMGELRVRGAKVTTPKDAVRIAKLRAEGLRARQTIFHGDGRVYGVHAGELFTLSGHPRQSLDGSYLVTKMHVRGHSAGQLSGELKKLLEREDEPDDVLHTELEALWSEVQYRPELRTQPPRVYSMEGGFIEGDVESDYAQLDEHGRYLVKFRFDEREGRGSQASARIRMMQPHAGSPEGMHFPLRKGTEVLIAFVGGDPDRPVIAGAVPNALSPSVVHSGNATRNVIHTGGNNKIQIEDELGKQHIHLRTPHKNTYLHLGAPFNPSYTKATSTDGTSISYTRDISTSMTGTDAQTLVEDSRITVIGRGLITPGDLRGTEITALVGLDFINRATGDLLFGEIAADVKQAASDFQALALAVEKLNGYIAKPTTPLDAELDVTAVASAAKAALADLTTLQTDATRYNDLATAGTANFETSIGQQWLGDVGAALTSMTNINTSLKGVTDPATVAGFFPSTAASGSTPATSWTTVFVTALGTDANFVQLTGSAAGSTPPKAPSSSLPTLPNPSAPPQYIAITHPSGQATTMDPTSPPATADTWVGDQIAGNATSTPPVLPSGQRALTTVDPVAINRGTTSPGPLNPGSDVKIVGGDNVTQVAMNARSEIGGHSFSLVGRDTTSAAGQTTVVFGGVLSTAYCANKMVPMSAAPQDATLKDGNAAQSTVAWGDTYAVVNGTVNSTINGDQHTKVGDWGQLRLAESQVYGEQNAFVFGSRSADILGSDACLVAGFKTGFVLGMKTDIAIGLSLQLDATMHLHATAADKLETQITSMQTSVDHMETTVSHISSNMNRVYETLVAMYVQDTALNNGTIYAALMELHNHL